jgi:hypothetical protein
MGQGWSKTKISLVCVSGIVLALSIFSPLQVIAV